MNIFGNVPRLGDRVALLLCLYDPAGSTPSWLTPTSPMNARYQAAATRDKLRIVEGKVSGIQAWRADSSRMNDHSTIGTMTVVVPAANGNGDTYISVGYDGYGVNYVLNNLRRMIGVFEYGADDTRLLAQMCFPQAVASEEYVRMIKDIRGDNETPASIANTQRQVLEVCDRLALPFVPLVNFDSLLSTTTLCSETLEDGPITQENLDMFDSDPTVGRVAPSVAPSRPTRPSLRLSDVVTASTAGYFDGETTPATWAVRNPFTTDTANEVSPVEPYDPPSPPTEQF